MGHSERKISNFISLKTLVNSKVWLIGLMVDWVLVNKSSEQIFTLIKRCQFPNIVAGVQGHVFIYFYFPLQFSQTYSESHKIFHLTFTLCCQIQLWKVKTTLYNSICIEIYHLIGSQVFWILSTFLKNPSKFSNHQKMKKRPTVTLQYLIILQSLPNTCFR